MKYTIVGSPLGRILIAATPRGIAWLGLGDSDAELEDEIRSDLPRAELSRDDRALRSYAGTLRAYLRGESGFPALALDVTGTAFQRRVWDELLAIPQGATRSYGEIARLIGRPAAARAVGTAVGSNPVAILIPCHRALRESGALGGYRWGLDRKVKLLTLEGAAGATARGKPTRPPRQKRPTR